MAIKSEVKEAIQGFADKRQVPCLLIDSEINRTILNRIFNLLCKKELPKLDIILQTPGGDIDAAYGIAKLVRKAATEVTITVPHYAKSAGTLICLAADQLLLTDLSELGPLDTQIYETQEGGSSKYVSALNGSKALEQVQINTIETADIFAKLILSRSHLKISDAIQLSTEFAGKTGARLYDKLDPIRIGEYARALEVGQRYGIRILTEFMGWSHDQANVTVTTLVQQYPHHGYVIDHEELMELGLPSTILNGDILDEVINIRSLLINKKLENQVFLTAPIEASKDNREKVTGGE